MQNSFDSFSECAKWMTYYLEDHIVLRAFVNRGRETLVILLSVSSEWKLLQFAYDSLGCPSPEVFKLSIFPGDNLTERVNNMMLDWQRQGLVFWTGNQQAEAFESNGFSTSPINALSLDMLSAYQRLLGCLECNPEMPEIYISDVITAHKRLKGFLDEQTNKITHALSHLSTLTNK